MEEGRSVFKILTGTLSGINMRRGLEEIGINAGNGVDWAQDRDYWIALVNAGLKLRVP